MTAPHVPGHTMTMAITSRLADIAVSCSCRERGDHIETRPVLPAREAYRLWLEHVGQASAPGRAWVTEIGYPEPGRGSLQVLHSGAAEPQHEASARKVTV